MFGIDKLILGAEWGELLLAPTYDNLLLCIRLGAALTARLLLAIDEGDCIAPDGNEVGRNVEYGRFL